MYIHISYIYLYIYIARSGNQGLWCFRRIVGRVGCRWLHTLNLTGKHDIQPKTNIRMKSLPFESMYFLLNMVIFQPVMLVFRGVTEWFPRQKISFLKDPRGPVIVIAIPTAPRDRESERHIWSVIRLKISWAPKGNTTVDGRNPAPSGMYKTLKIMG